MVIHGLVGPSGTGCFGGGSKEEDTWTLGLTLAAHRQEDASAHQAVVNEPLYLRQRLIPQDGTRAAMDALPAMSLRRLEVRITGRNSHGRLEGELLAVLGESEDPALKRVQAELKKPVAVQDRRFGLLVLIRRVGWFEGQTRWLDTDVKVHLEAENTEALAEVLPEAHALFADQTAWQARLDAQALHDLLDLKNRSWADPGEEVDAAEFLEAMSLQSVTVGPGGSFTFWFDDGDLFWGHSIAVSGTLAGGPEEAGIHG